MDFLSLQRWKDIKIEEIYHPKYQECLRLFMDGTFVLSCVLYTFTAYVILTKSLKQMGAFKYTVFTQTSFNMLYKIVMFIFNPIMHFPLPVITANSYFGFGMEWIVPLLGMAFLGIIAAGVAILFSMLNRVLAAFNTNSLKQSSIRFSSGIFAFIVLTSIIWISLMVPLFMLNPHLEASWKSLQGIIPALIEINEIFPNTFGFDPSQSGQLLKVFIFIAVGWTFIYTVAFITLNIVVLYQLKKIKQIVSKTTYSMHKMLHTALIIQTKNLILFAIIPIAILAITFLLQLSYGSWIANLAVPISSVHLIIDASSLLYFIKPYRKFVFQLFLRRRGNENSNNVCKSEAFSIIQKRNGTVKPRNLSIIENLQDRNGRRHENVYHRGPSRGGSGSF